MDWSLQELLNGLASKWYRLFSAERAERGDAGAQFNLGVRYANGRGVLQDNKEAVKWYRLSAEQGDAIAQCNLGGMYNEGQGVPQDYKEAIKYFRLSAEQGNADAQMVLDALIKK
jgi:TPR repeat protein